MNIHETMAEMARQLKLADKIDDSEYRLFLDYIARAMQDEKDAKFWMETYDALVNTMKWLC